MRVRIAIFDGYLQVEPAGRMAGGALGESIGSFARTTVRPGERWHGWKYSRLRKLGDGEHDLVHKRDHQRRNQITLQGR